MAKFTVPVRQGQELTTTVQDLTYEGMGVVKVDNYPLFVDNALPGEEVTVLVTRTNKQYGFARVTKRLTTSPDRVAGEFADYLQTSIAPLAHLKYSAQLQFKQDQVKHLFAAQHLDIPVLPTLPSPQQTGYRNKAQIPVQMINGTLTTGFFRKRSHHLVPLTDFFIQDPRIDEIIVTVRDILRDLDVTAYDERTRRGLLRHIMVRRGHTTGEVMIVLVVTRIVPMLKQAAQLIEKAVPDLTTLVWNVNAANTNVILSGDNQIISGPGYIEDTIGERRFKISPQSFFQINAAQTPRLYAIAQKLAEFTGHETVIDAYAGIGTIGLTIAPQVDHVYGMEVVPEAVADAEANKALNRIDNADYVVGTAEDVLPRWQQQGITADVLIVDPPRKGLAESFIATVGAMKIPRVIYVSCNPATLARDLVRFQALGYQATSPTQVVDMFPQTPHIESVTRLDLR